ncbi:MAG TPA: flavodoxin domain-containing protein [Kofleriaceae bacterium]|nr:flavodoxin domain-containing protein [Kofleriaceae bacterium]
MSRILIAYASSYGQTKQIAEALSGSLRRRGHVVELADAFAGAPPPVEDYDAVVLGSHVQFGVHARPIVQYAAANRVALEEMPSFFFSVSMAAASTTASDPQGYLEKLLAATEWRPRAAIAFAGGLPYRKYSWLMRWIMKLISQRAGHSTDTSHDHDYTDWAQVERFAATIATTIAAELATRPLEPAPPPVADSGAPHIR